MGEGHNIVNTRAQQHHQDAQTDQGVGRQELDQSEHQHGHGDEVDRQQGPHEPEFAQRPTEGGHRNLQEGDEQHQGQGRIDRPFPCFRAGDEEPYRHCADYGGEVDPDLPRFQSVS
ncbi:hypothetical protein D3C80_1110950 [compost metagenome]